MSLIDIIAVYYRIAHCKYFTRDIINIFEFEFKCNISDFCKL